MKENTGLVKQLLLMESGESMNVERVSYDELFNLKYPEGSLDNPELRGKWNEFEITAVLGRDYGHYKVGQQAVVWMVSRMGDVGVTGNLVNPTGYDVRGVECEDLYNWKFKRR